ncbi:MAG TPA: teichoic acid biosynthesis protein C [Candidatus Avipropionibacterium avicola]|uniref:Teichoic acid biosynthesis protein C n=1 Tax=Candidatus Avipropionibacterium avicola TaxID=2840701 RepID=A0A9D1KMX3_9ACTN|nr:teichoic acid biosynthesis protein C [Candidatus Avipropionibacterium avicola]
MTNVRPPRRVPTANPEGRFSRRGLLAGAGAAALAAPFASSALATAAIPAADDEWSVLLDEKTLHHTTVLQCFGFEPETERIYALQVHNNDTHALGLTELDHSGKETGHMVLDGFGHGGNIGVERVGSTTYLWTETDANPSSGYGRAITRFPFDSGTTLTYGESDLPIHRPVAGSTSNQPYVDNEGGRLIVRHRVSGVPKYGIYDLEAATAGNYDDPLAYIDQYIGEEGETFQGFCLHGDQIHQSTGKAYTDEDGDNPPSGGGNAYLSTITADTGELVSRTKNLVAPDLVYREPEGLAIKPGSTPQLVMGFATGEVGARTFSLFAKPVG